ncbi:YARHG domain-containing protein [Flavobacterium cerinum]|uniref:YARHG domain-containing protein n=1 Tax=Flavobacterium cerinum TaxID=2502784 RepID=A0ABY5IU71_9FLAO|nr:YARHG domain-containing protein [Flavobacterium cerinum]UUC45303.1 YARHG domain-containing protein [Flavobacterium cerinum]
MKKIIFFALVLTLAACNSKDKKTTDSIENIASNETVKETNTELYGSWVGDFIVVEQKDPAEYHPDNKISIVLKKITPEQVIGQSVVAGNSRPLTGTLSGNKFILKEPGDHKYDGVFEFEFRNDSLIGNWTAFNTNIAVPKRSFGLAKKQFIYDPKLMLPEEGDYVDWYNPKQKEQEIEGETFSEEYYRQASDEITQLNASTQKLTEPILKNLKKLDLEIIRNTIYARHGYTFKKKSIRQFFDPVSWYMPVSDNVDNELTPLEKDNIALLKRFEKYAEDNYDTFGR